jgi:nitrate/nitrite-specific signal transduction histidine kinase
MVAVSAICFLILVGLVLTIIRGGIVRPLKILEEHYGRLAEGIADTEMPDTSRYFDEVKALALHHKTICNAVSQIAPNQSKPHQKD